MFVLYPESQQRAIEYAQKNFPCAWALHDKDVHAEKDYSKYLASTENRRNGKPVT